MADIEALIETLLAAREHVQELATHEVEARAEYATARAELLAELVTPENQPPLRLAHNGQLIIVNGDGDDVEIHPLDWSG